jgi:hypothetical protein
MSSIKIGSGSISTTLLKLPLNDFLRIVQANKGFRGDANEKALIKLYKKVNPDETERPRKEIDATPKRKAGGTVRGGGSGKRK